MYVSVKLSSNTGLTYGTSIATAFPWFKLHEHEVSTFRMLRCKLCMCGINCLYMWNVALISALIVVGGLKIQPEETERSVCADNALSGAA